MRYSISLIVLTLLAAAALKGSLSFKEKNKGSLFMAAAQQPSQGNQMSVNTNPPPGLNDQAQQLWRTLTPEQKAAVKQDIQNGVDPNQAVLNYAEEDNTQSSSVEDTGSHSTSENYDEGSESNGLENTLNSGNNSTGSKPTKTDKMTSDAKSYSGSGSTEDEEDETDANHQAPKDPANRPTYAPGGENSPEPGNTW